MTNETTAAEARRLLEMVREVLNRLVHWSHGIQVAKPDQVWPDGRNLIAAIDAHLSAAEAVSDEDDDWGAGPFRADHAAPLQVEAIEPSFADSGVLEGTNRKTSGAIGQP